jgi:hypothetical protein
MQFGGKIEWEVIGYGMFGFLEIIQFASAAIQKEINDTWILI